MSFHLLWTCRYIYGGDKLTAFVFVTEIAAIISAVTHKGRVDAKSIGATELIGQTFAFGAVSVDGHGCKNEERKSITDEIGDDQLHQYIKIEAKENKKCRMETDQVDKWSRRKTKWSK